MGVFTAWDMHHPLEDGKDEFELYHVYTPRNKTPVFHTHDFYEIYFFIAGDLCIHLEEYDIHPKPNSAIIFPPGYMHQAAIRNTEAYYDRMFIYISPSCLESMSMEGFSPLQILQDCAAKGAFHHTLTDEVFTQCVQTFSEVISAAVANSDPHQRLINRCRVIMMMTALCKAFQENGNQGAAHTSKRIHHVIAYINEHLTEELSLEELGNRFFVSKYHLSREFKAHSNKSLHQYILSKRVILAKQLMQQGVCPTDVFLRCGFREYSSFYKAFRKDTECSPQQYYNYLQRTPLRGIGSNNPDCAPEIHGDGIL